MRWVISHRALVIVLSIIIVIVILFAVSWRLQGAGGVVGNIARTAVSVVQKPVSYLTDKISNGLGFAFADNKLKDENARLVQENEDLKLELIKERLNTEQLNTLNELSSVFNVNSPTQNFKFQAATVLTLERSGVFNTFTIDAGTECGIDRNSVVLNGDGLIGRVYSAGHGWAKVIAITDESNNVSFQIRHTGGKSSLGVCYGKGDGTLTGNMLDESGFAVVGDQAITSGIGGIYPGGLVIGTVTKAEFIKGSSLMSLEIKPAVDVKALHKVLVIV